MQVNKVLDLKIKKDQAWNPNKEVLSHKISPTFRLEEKSLIFQIFILSSIHDRLPFQMIIIINILRKIVCVSFQLICQ